jgi:hypothetical protein
MYSCDNCDKVFKYPYLLVKHYNQKKSCKVAQTNQEEITMNLEDTHLNQECTQMNQDNQDNQDNNSQMNQDNSQMNQEHTQIENGRIQCTECKKILYKKNLKRHSKSCTKQYVLECPICKVVIDSTRSKFNHKNKCTPIEQQVQQQEVQQTQAQAQAPVGVGVGTSNVINNISNNINNTQNITIINYITTYNKDTRTLISENPEAPCQELLCLNGFKLETVKNRLPNIDRGELQRLITNIREKKDYDVFYRFFFRNIDNKRLHMFILGKNNNTTHAQVFNNGNFEKMDKTKLFDSVCKYLGQYLLNISIDNIDVIGMLVSDPNSRKSFMEIIKSNSNTFDYYKNNQESSELRIT